MLDLEAELDAVVGALARNAIEYAVCGGLAMAVHGRPRATIDIDLLIQPADEERVYEAVAPLGYRVKANPMDFAGGAKIDADGDTLMLDLLLVTQAFAGVWKTREAVEWRDRPLWVVSRSGLIALKSARSSKQDLADIERLESDE